MPLKNLKESEIGYIAGIIDGEGCIRIKNNGFSGVVSLHVTNTDIDLLNWLKEVTGLGFVYCSRKKLYSAVSCRKVYNWELNPKDCYELLPKIIPFLITKREQAILALEFKDTLTKGRQKVSVEQLEKRNWIKEQIKLLKRKGEYLAAT